MFFFKDWIENRQIYANYRKIYDSFRSENHMLAID